LQELLADSDFAVAYRQAAIRVLQAEADLDTTRSELAGAFAKLELRRLNRELQTLADQRQPAPEALARMRALSERRAWLMAGAAGGAGGDKIAR
jgi:predicted  nucleic acid-binding Zn-ribbon protein